MADEVANAPESSDPIEAVMRSHLSRMQQIADEQNDKTKQLCDDVVTTIRRHAGFKNDILDRALSALGIEPAQESKSTLDATGEPPEG